MKRGIIGPKLRWPDWSRGWLLIIPLLLVLVVGCATTGMETGYRTLWMSGTARDGLMTKAGEYWSQGLISEESKNEILVADRAVRDTALIAIAALKVKVRVEALENAPPEEIEAAKKAYDEAIREFNTKWASFTGMFDRYMLDWLVKE